MGDSLGMNELQEYQWHEFPWDKAPKLLRRRYKKLKLCADANIPKPVIDELRAAGLVIDSVTESGLGRHPDENILQRARELGQVILTMDRDFWNDGKHPLQKSPGIIFIDIAPDQLDKAIEGLVKFYVLFAKAYPLDWWHELKCRVTANSFVIKGRSREGTVFEEEFKLTDDGKLVTRKIR